MTTPKQNRKVYFYTALLTVLIALLSAGCKTTCPAYSGGYKGHKPDRFYAEPVNKARTAHYRHKERPSLIEWAWNNR